MNLNVEHVGPQRDRFGGRPSIEYHDLERHREHDKGALEDRSQVVNHEDRKRH